MGRVFKRASDVLSNYRDCSSGYQKSVLINALAGRRQWFKYLTLPGGSHTVPLKCQNKVCCDRLHRAIFRLVQGPFAQWFWPHP